MDAPQWVKDLFRAVDAGNVDGFVQFMADDVRFRAGSSAPLLGKQAVRQDITALLANIRGMRHDLSLTLVHGDIVVVHGTVTYTRHDGSTLTVPFADVWTMKGEKIQEYLIFIDNTKL
jgi:ketosteroid isomerase-like protein